MSKYFYSKTTGGFYDAEIHGTMPADAVGISNDTYRGLMKAQAEGMVIVADANGYPQAVERGPGTLEEQEASARYVRNRKLAESDWTQGADVQAAMDDATKKAWADYRQALRDVPKQPGFPTDITWPTAP